jgi:hypothetical protein
LKFREEEKMASEMRTEALEKEIAKIIADKKCF